MGTWSAVLWIEDPARDGDEHVAVRLAQETLVSRAQYQLRLRNIFGRVSADEGLTQGHVRSRPTPLSATSATTIPNRPLGSESRKSHQNLLCRLQSCHQLPAGDTRRFSGQKALVDFPGRGQLLRNFLMSQASTEGHQAAKAVLAADPNGDHAHGADESHPSRQKLSPAALGEPQLPHVNEQQLAKGTHCDRIGW